MAKAKEEIIQEINDNIPDNIENKIKPVNVINPLISVLEYAKEKLEGIDGNYVSTNYANTTSANGFDKGFDI